MSIFLTITFFYRVKPKAKYYI